MPEETSERYARAVEAAWSERRNPAVRSWWQSPVVQGAINKRVTGSAETRFEQWFRDRYVSTPVGRALSLGAGGGQLELSMLELGVAREIVGVDISAERVAGANAVAADSGMAGRLRFEQANLETWSPTEAFDLLIARDVLHHIAGLEQLCDGLKQALRPGALIYVDEFVGPRRFQWTDKQVALIERLLAGLDDELVLDLVDPERGPRREVARPTVEAMIAADPSESVRSDELMGVFADNFELVERRPYGGAIFHQLFNRIMGNFSGHDDLVRALMEIDFTLTDEGVVGSDYELAIFRVPGGS